MGRHLSVRWITLFALGCAGRETADTRLGLGPQPTESSGEVEPFVRHVREELAKIEDMAPKFADHEEVEYAVVKTAKSVMYGLMKECEGSFERTAVLSEEVAALLARRQRTRPHEYYYLWLGSRFFDVAPPRAPAFFDGLVYRVSAERTERGGNEVRGEMMVMCVEILEELLRPPVAVVRHGFAIEWETWGTLEKWYESVRSRVHYDAESRKWKW
jgi:hypothetical protein